MSGDPFSIEAIQHEHDCGCEFCAKTLQVCPASASSYAQEILSLRLENARLESRIAVLRTSLNSLVGHYSIEDINHCRTRHRGSAAEICCGDVVNAFEALKQSPSTALAEFLGPTIEVLKSLEMEIHVLGPESHFHKQFCMKVGNEVCRLASAIGGDK